ncbi:hypothetical protein [Sphingomonas crocodyli]|uniref:Uncharacterized protein n=1 Tax=Sphingomonas crocodyli TaxID=1979270 RepID=A0A437M5M1_9SPHN|nr:hypothetical protein [Sphingomonas crocodyli]RVT92998.1 hypothetical protein EOD43_03590 [Sphingomonas crocodyli]
MRSDKEWILISDAVYIVSDRFECSLEAASKMLLAYSTGHEVGVRFGWSHAEADERDFAPVIQKQAGFIPFYDWQQIASMAISDNGYRWTENTIITEYIDEHSRFLAELSGVQERPYLTVFGDVCFSRGSLGSLLLERTHVSGSAVGHFWHELSKHIVAQWHFAPPSKGSTPDRVSIRAAADSIRAKMDPHNRPSFAKLRLLLAEIYDHMEKVDPRTYNTDL